MKNIIFDCDNTYGVPDCDVDDGLTLIYLLGNKDANLLGVTTTYGNNKVEIVYPNTLKMIKELKVDNLPVIEGGKDPKDLDNKASDYLVKMANEYEGELSILATGSLTNLYGAYLKDNTFFEKVKEIVLMGGITEPLIFAKRQMDELNFSCDPIATYTVLTKGNNVSVITGNNCLKVLVTREDYERELSDYTNPIVPYIKNSVDYWFDYNLNKFGINGTYNWDVTAAVYLMRPELFKKNIYKMNLSVEDLKRGFLRIDEENNCTLNLPTIDNEELYNKDIYNTWKGVVI
ncbi:nucleoside hydrolase [Terrisporobacter sp.]|uniref:nucleoside hydrolase n=2 Tax=Terrisporobacter TaxID=1505652 RepID=UPI00289AA796|nr:nucleoside hydrolase [Terrisporobacter sp.]